MKRSKADKVEQSNTLLLRESYCELQDELKSILEKISSLNRFVVEEKDLNKMAKVITNRINEVSSLISSTTFTAKSFYELTVSNIEQFTSVASQMDKSLSKLRHENEELTMKCCKPGMVDKSINTDDDTPAHMAVIQQMEISMEERESELNSRIQVLLNDRRQLKNRVIEQYSSIQSLKMELQDLERKRRADKILIEELEADTSLLIPRTQSSRNTKPYSASISPDNDDSREYLVSSADVDRFLQKLSKNESHRSEVTSVPVSSSSSGVSGANHDPYRRGGGPSLSVPPRGTSAPVVSHRYSRYEQGSSDEDTPPTPSLSNAATASFRHYRGREVLVDEPPVVEEEEDSLVYSEASSSFSSPAISSVSSSKRRAKTAVAGGGAAVASSHFVSPYPEEDDDYFDTPPPPPPPVLDPPSSSSSRPPLSTRPISQEEDRRRKKLQSRALEEAREAEERQQEVEEGDAVRSEVVHQFESLELSGEVYDYAEEVAEEESHGVYADHERPAEYETSATAEEEEDDFDGENFSYQANNEGNTSVESGNPLAVSADDSITMIHRYFS